MRVRSWMALAVVVVAGAPAAAGDAGNDRGKSDAAPPKWEYKYLTKNEILDLGKNDLAAGMNKLGDEGWELVAVEPRVRGENDSGPAVYYFKRPASRAEAAASPSAPAEFRVYQLKYAEAVDTAKVLDKLLNGPGAQVRIVADQRTNQVLTQSSAESSAEVEAILQRLDVPTGK